jgi:dTDP-4-dehydrorhamnose reductase
MNILLLGKGGQVGWELQRALAIMGPVVSCDFDSHADLKADFRDPDSLASLVRRVRPDVIVNAAAYTAVDKAESEPDLARVINATAPGVLAREAAALGACLVHYSTDYVFDGSGQDPRDEEAPTGPLNVYGQTKLEGEDLIRTSGCRHLILRTSWVYSARGGNFARTMLKLAAQHEALRVIDDQVGAPTGADLLADITALAVYRLTERRAPTGTYHCVASGATSWHGYATMVIECARRMGIDVKVHPDRIHAIPTSDYPTPARRPLNSRLNNHKLQSALGVQFPDWQSGVERMLTELMS